MPIDNPMDIWPALMKHGIDHVYRTALRAILEDPAVNGVICIAIAPDLPGQEHLDAIEVIRGVASDFPEKPVVTWLYGPNQNVASNAVEKGGYVVSVPTLPRAARTLAALHKRRKFLLRAYV
jgi:acyl-CoA synthetase (NDP forming)